MSRVARALLAALAVTGAVVVVARPAAADDPRLRLVAQAAWAPIGGGATLRLDIPPEQLPDGDVDLRLRLYNRVTTLEDFEESMNVEELSGRLTTRRIPVADLTRDADGIAAVTVGVGDSDITPTVAATRPGVYPLEVALEDGNETITSFVTWIVALDPDDAGESIPMRVAWVWSVVAPPVRGVDGTPYDDVTPEFAPGGRLDGISSLLAAAGAMPMTLEVGPETLEGWTALADADPTVAPALERVAAAAARPTTQLLPAPYVPIDLTSLHDAGLFGELPDQLVTGADTLELLTGVRPDPGTMAVDPASDAVLAGLRSLLVDRVLVPATQMTDGDEPLQPFSISAGPDTIRAAASTAVVDEMLEGNDATRLRVQRALGALSVLALDDPETARGVVIEPPAEASLDIEAYSVMLEMMRAHPLFTASTLDDVFSRVDPEVDDDDAPVVRALAPIEPETFPVSSIEYDASALQLSSLQTTVEPDHPVLAQGARALQLSLSTEQTSVRAREQLRVIDSGIQALDAGITTTKKRVTLTSRRADVPLSFRNDTGAPVTVVVHLNSSKLNFPKGNAVELELPEGNSTESFAVEARTSGTFTMTVTLTSPDGRLQIGPPTKVTVRSAVFSGVGAALTVGALLFLALWWGNHWRRTRRARAATAEPT